MKRLVVGMMAHVDAGKTTLSEALLFRTGEIRRLGRVDHQNAFLDNHEMERQRGITIFAHQAMLRTGNAAFTLLDTPGHIDFSAETERTMQVLDYAILVISGTDGIQSHTETLWRLLKHYHVPVFLFVNKMDLPGVDREARLAECKARLSGGCMDFSEMGSPAFYEMLALYRESWMEEYLETGEIARSHLQKGIAAETLVPVFFGSARDLVGVDDLLTGLDRFTMEKDYPNDFGGMVYKIAVDEKNNRLTYLKVTGGVLHVRDSITYSDERGNSFTEKVSQIRIYAGSKYTTSETALAGTVCAVTGFSHSYAGQGWGNQPNGLPPVLTSVLRYGICLPEHCNPADVWKQLEVLAEEDPTLHLIWDARHQQIQVQVMGTVQLEVLQKLIADRFALQVTFDDGQIAYRETIAAPVEGVGHYEPLRHYAEVHLLLEPLSPGSGLQFASCCRSDDLDRNWQRLILTHLAEKTHIGVLTGAPITDMRIILCAGRAHVKHTEGGDFRQATYRAVRNGLRKAKSVLLEPWVQYTLELPSIYVGKAMTDLQQMGARSEPPETQSDRTILRGSAPTKGIRGYAVQVRAYTKGQGRLTSTPAGYAPCADSESVIAQIGYDCDADLENSADSIFCAHGSGFTVRWDQVEQYMHLPLQIPTQTAQATEKSELAPRRPAASFAEDAELMAIFERTYGKIQRSERHALHTPREETQSISLQQLDAVKHTEYLLVDGYNMIFAWEELKQIAMESLDAARARLEHILSNYNGYRQSHLILVFDAYRVKGQHREVEQRENLQIVYTKEAETADAYIEKAAHDLAKHHRVRVATSDGMEQLIILGQGALRVPAEEFRQEVLRTSAEIRTKMAELAQHSEKNTLGRTISLNISH